MVKISSLPADASPTVTDYVAAVDTETTTTKKVLLSSLIALFFNNIPSGAHSDVTRGSETFYDFVKATTGIWTADSVGVNKNASMTAMTVYINGRRISISAVVSRVFTASKDTYIDVLDNLDGTGTLVYTEVANAAASPALAANSVRVGKIITGATTIAATSSIVQLGSDSLSNLIYPQLTQKTTVLRQDDTTNAAQNKTVMLTGWGYMTPGALQSVSEQVNFGVTFAQRPIVVITMGGDTLAASTTYGAGGNTVQGLAAAKVFGITTTAFQAYVWANAAWSAGNTVFYQWIAIGEVL